MNPENLQDNELVEFLWQRMSQDCPLWAITVPVLFAFFVVGLIVVFRQERKALSAIIGVGIVGAISIVYLPMAYILRPVFSWMVVLVPVMTVALFYVGLMYIRDARSVHPLWAIFLGMLRTTVYLVLAVVFMLPGCQRSERQEYESKVIVLFDVSGSQLVVDDLPEPGQDPATLPSRQDKVLKFLLSRQDAAGKEKAAFIETLMEKSPLTCYRFGPILDETDIVNLNIKKEQSLGNEAWSKWLKPNKKDIEQPNVDDVKDEEKRKELLNQYAKKIDLVDLLKSGTNIGGSCLQAHKIENNSFVQAIIVISDGQSNVGSDDAKSEFIARVTQSRKPIPVITVGVGQFRLPSAIKIDDLQAPEETRPDDKFPIRVPVVGTNLHGEPFKVTLEARRVKDLNGRVVDEKPIELPVKEGKFQGAGDHPQDTVEFEIDVAQLKGLKSVKDDPKGDLIEGEWQFKARVPRNAKEAFPDPEHVTEPVKVQVQKRALRVLIFAGGSTREYQFLRTILYREMVEKRMEMCIYNQQLGKDDHVDQDVPPERLLGDFPNRIGPNEAGQQFMSLSDYDVVVCFDPDWAKLTPKQLTNLREWVGDHGGGVIFVAGPVFSYLLARPGGRDLSELQKIYPVVPQDNRLHNVAIGKLGHDSTRPYVLHFPPGKKFDFLKLEEEGDSPTAGWNGFFWNNEKHKEEPGKDVRPKRGFYSYYPVERLKPASEVAATFAGPKESRINGGKDEMPYIVSMPFGSGKTLYLGSGEFWRLRAYKDGYHERIWIKMARHVAGGAIQQKKYGRILLSRSLPVGVVNFEAQIKGKDQQYLPKTIVPTVRVKRIDKNKDEKAEPLKFDLVAKPAEEKWLGYFQGSIHLKEPGEYEFLLPIPGMDNESLRQNLTVRKPNPELDNVRTNFGYLYQLATDAGPLLKTLPADTRKEIEATLQIPAEADPGEERSTKRLFFPITAADSVAKCIVPIPPKTETAVKGPPEHLWALGFESGLQMMILQAALFMLLGWSVIGAVFLLLMRQWIGGILCVVSFFVVGSVTTVVSLWPEPEVIAVVWTVLTVFAHFVGMVGGIWITIEAFRKNVIEGVLTLFVPFYIFYFVIAKLEHSQKGLMVAMWLGGPLLGILLTVLSILDLGTGVEPLSVGFSFVLLLIGTLLGVEWLTRKLLRLA